MDRGKGRGIHKRAGRTKRGGVGSCSGFAKTMAKYYKIFYQQYSQLNQGLIQLVVTKSQRHLVLVVTEFLKTLSWFFLSFFLVLYYIVMFDRSKLTLHSRLNVLDSWRDSGLKKKETLFLLRGTNCVRGWKFEGRFSNSLTHTYTRGRNIQVRPNSDQIFQK